MNHSHLCQCGFDFTDFVRQHEITSGAYFQCPECDTGLAAQSVDLSLLGAEHARANDLSHPQPAN